MKNKSMLCAAFLMFSVSSGVIARMRDHNTNYRAIMNQSWTPHQQILINASWRNWDDNQKEAVLNRMVEQGLLSEDEVADWDYNQIPQKSYGG
jgi:hypothetical protein